MVLNCKVEVIVVAAAGIEGRIALRTAIATVHVFVDGQDRSAGAAENGALLPFACGPKSNGMTGEGVMTIFAGVEKAAALHLYGDDVHGKMVVSAAGLGVEVDAADVFWDFYLRFRLVWRIHRSAIL